jgi:DNA-binding NtrC family response regulator
MARLLIVEDDRPFAEVLAAALALEGHDVRIAGTANDGIELGLAYGPDVVITDWMLRNDLHGGDVCRAICETHPETKGIVITGYLDAVSDAARSCDSIVAVVEKPFHTEQIAKAIRQALQPEEPAIP